METKNINLSVSYNQLVILRFAVEDEIEKLREVLEKLDSERHAVSYRDTMKHIADAEDLLATINNARAI